MIYNFSDKLMFTQYMYSQVSNTQADSFLIYSRVDFFQKFITGKQGGRINVPSKKFKAEHALQIET